ncbi:HU family DNA-binding protein [Bacteroides sp.]
MSVEYELHESPDIRKTGEKQPLYPRIVSKGTVDQDEFLDRVSKFTGISRSLLSGAMESFQNELCDLLASGWNVELGDIGYFSASLQCPPVMDPKEIRANSINLKNINFRVGSRFKKEIAHKMRLERRVQNKTTPSRELTEATCIKLLNEYLDANPCINRAQYSRLTGRGRKQALKELNLFIEQGILRKHGMGKLTVYVRK